MVYYSKKSKKKVAVFTCYFIINTYNENIMDSVPGHGTKENNLPAEKARLAQLANQLSGQDFYSRLKLSTSATTDEINKAFRKSATQFHPDGKHKELEESYKEIFSLYSEAKNTLTNQEQKTRYDRKHGRWTPPPTSGSNKTYSSTPPRNQKTYSPPPRPTQPPESAEKKKARAIKEIEEAQNTGPYTFKGIVNNWVKTGIITKAEIVNLPFVKKFVLSDIKKAAVIGPSTFKSTIKDWIKDEYITFKEIQALPFVREFVINDIKKAAITGPATFESTIKDWIKVNYITREEVMDFPFVKKFVLSDIKKAAVAGPHTFKSTVNGWVKNGYISKEEASEILRQSEKK
ncbi:MAG TPA: DnaJ domain-containing protein [Candidatus Paceibacterota bacterium]|nr:DnaJ domain-containing protein [Candidatus Paceibacterota bacterium]